MSNAKAPRNAKGQLLPGAVNNPNGRPKGSKNQITILRDNTELALRKYLESPRRAALAQKALDRVFDIAANGDDKEALSAIKLLMDKMLPNASAAKEEAAGGRSQRPIAIQIVNSTDATSGKPVAIIDGETGEIEYEDSDG
jgi:hypothetical protein